MELGVCPECHQPIHAARVWSPELGEYVCAPCAFVVYNPNVVDTRGKKGNHA